VLAAALAILIGVAYFAARLVRLGWIATSIATSEGGQQLARRYHRQAVLEPIVESGSRPEVAVTPNRVTPNHPVESYAPD